MAKLPHIHIFYLAEGSVNKIKIIKRIMYGRNSFELLKAEVLCRSVGIHWNNNGYFNHPLWELIFSILGNLAVLICFVIVVLYKKKR